MDVIRIMQRVELFRGLNEEQLGQVANISHEEVYNHEHVIFKQGDIGDRMYIVGQGQVEVRVNGREGNIQNQLYLGAGQVFGEMALIDAGRRSAAVLVAEDSTTVYSILNDEFTALCQSNTEIGYIMMRNIAQDLSFKLRHRDFDPSKS